jgi:hypothetical protein
MVTACGSIENNTKDGDVEMYPPESATKFHTIYWYSVSISSSLGGLEEAGLPSDVLDDMVDVQYS